VADLGVVVDAAEARTAAVCVSPSGEARLVVAARGLVLIADPETGDCGQLTWDEAAEDPFASLATSDGMFWTGAGRWLIRVDPFARQLTLLRPCDDEPNIAFSLAEGPDGRIWFTTYPSARLFWVSPDGTQIEEAERLSDTEAYVFYLAVDDDGWVYAGIGTEHKDLVAVLPGTEGPVSLALPEARVKGKGYVHRSADGAIYGHCDSSERPPGDDGHEWKRLSAGAARPVQAPAPSLIQDVGSVRIHVPAPPPWSVRELDFDTRRLIVANAAGQLSQVRLDYRCSGANLSPLTRGPDGLIYGTSNHPLHLYTLDPATGWVTEHGPHPVATARGNICAWAEQERVLAGAAYAGGHLGLLDPARPIATGVNPRWVSEHGAVHRPRCIVAHPDREHLVWSGYGGYGDTGGGLVITHRPAASAERLNEADQVLAHTDVIAHHATTALGALASWDVVGATSIETPGGARPVATAGAVYVLEWSTRTVTRRWEPHLDVRTWAELAVAEDDMVHLLSAEGIHLLVDPTAQRVLGTDDWTEFGRTARGGVVLDGKAAFFLQQKAVTRVDLRTHEARVVAGSDEPITAGGAIAGGHLFVASGPRMLRIDIHMEGSS
jgi:streptogramin lyase